MLAILSCAGSFLLEPSKALPGVRPLPEKWRKSGEIRAKNGKCPVTTSGRGPNALRYETVVFSDVCERERINQR
jgi:hypothetical protein